MFTAELRVILPAIKFLIRLPQQEFIVNSDFQRALQSICNSFCSYPVVREIHRWLGVVHNRSKSVTFCWVPGHVGVAGNEQVDRAASAAVDNEIVSPVSLFLHGIVVPISLLPFGADCICLSKPLVQTSSVLSRTPSLCGAIDSFSNSFR